MTWSGLYSPFQQLTLEERSQQIGLPAPPDSRDDLYLARPDAFQKLAYIGFARVLHGVPCFHFLCIDTLFN